MNLLLIDRESSFLNALAVELEKRSICARQANDAFTAFQILSEDKIDLILTSSGIQGANTLLFLCSVKGRYPNTPLIMLAEQGAPINFNTALILGVDELIPRSATFNQLYTSISRFAA